MISDHYLLNERLASGYFTKKILDSNIFSVYLRRTVKLIANQLNFQELSKVVEDIIISLAAIVEKNKPIYNFVIAKSGTDDWDKDLTFLLKYHPSLVTPIKKIYQYYNCEKYLSVLDKVKFDPNDNIKGEVDFTYINCAEAVMHEIARFSEVNSAILLSIYCNIIKNRTGDIQTFSAYYNDTFKKIIDVFDLSELQANILYILYLIDIFKPFYTEIFDDSCDYFERPRGFARLISTILNFKTRNIINEVHKDSKLYQIGLIDINDRQFEISEHISNFIEENNVNLNILEKFYNKVSVDKALPEYYHNVEASSIKTLENLLSHKQGVNILIYGKPGTGKTEFTKTISSKTGKDLFCIKTNKNEKNCNLDHKKLSLFAALKLLNKNSILVVDEAEELLSVGSRVFYKDNDDNKAWLNTYMEGHNLNIIWIVNDLDMHASTKRRFDFSLKFDSFTKKQREVVLTNIHNRIESKIFTDTELKKIATNYSLDPGSFSLALKKSNNSKDDVYNILDSHVKLIHKKDSKERALEKVYDPSLINTTVSDHEILNAVNAYYKKEKPLHNLCILFEGLPGTGKTEFAKYISESVEKELDVKRASDLLSKWWGGTEKNISEAFNKAEIDEKILFIDECDSLFKSRDTAEKSWMVSETNELLTQMERFQGVLICATNFLDKVDRAAMRRFHLKVEFKNLLPEKIFDTYQKFFGNLKLGEMSSTERNKLESILNLNPGDFKAVSTALWFKDRVSHSEIIDRLKDEVSYKSLKKSISLV